MTAPVSLRLDDDVRRTLEADARARGVGLSTRLRQIAAAAAADIRRERIRAESEAVGRFLAADADAAALLDGLGAPPIEGL